MPTPFIDPMPFIALAALNNLGILLGYDPAPTFELDFDTTGARPSTNVRVGFCKLNQKEHTINGSF